MLSGLYCCFGGGRTCWVSWYLGLWVHVPWWYPLLIWWHVEEKWHWARGGLLDSNHQPWGAWKDRSEGRCLRPGGLHLFSGTLRLIGPPRSDWALQGIWEIEMCYVPLPSLGAVTVPKLLCLKTFLSWKMCYHRTDFLMNRVWDALN